MMPLALFEAIRQSASASSATTNRLLLCAYISSADARRIVVPQQNKRFLDARVFVSARIGAKRERK